MGKYKLAIRLKTRYQNFGYSYKILTEYGIENIQKVFTLTKICHWRSPESVLEIQVSTVKKCKGFRYMDIKVENGSELIKGLKPEAIYLKIWI